MHKAINQIKNNKKGGGVLISPPTIERKHTMKYRTYKKYKSFIQCLKSTVNISLVVVSTVAIVKLITTYIPHI